MVRGGRSGENFVGRDGSLKKKSKIICRRHASEVGAKKQNSLLLTNLGPLKAESSLLSFEKQETL
jgi:hypothetical protein